MSNKEAINAMHNNYLRVDFKEIPIQNTDILRWQDGRKWMVVSNGEEVEFNPLYHTVYQGEDSQYCFDDGKYEDATSETEGEKSGESEEKPREIDEDHATYDANTLGCITASAIAEEDKKLDSIITDYLDTVKLTDMIPKNMVQFDDTCYSQL